MSRGSRPSEAVRSRGRALLRGAAVGLAVLAGALPVRAEMRLQTDGNTTRFWRGDVRVWSLAGSAIDPGVARSPEPGEAGSPVLPNDFDLVAGWTSDPCGEQFSAFDLNGNGRSDLAYSCWGPNATFVREADADNSFALVHQVANPIGSYYTEMVCTGDADADGRAELVFATGTSGVPRDLFFVEARAPGLYPDSVVAVVPEVNIGVNHMRRADLDQDGLGEYVGTTQGTHSRLVAIWESRGDDSYAQVFSAHFGPGSAVSGEPSIGDFDGDGRNELVILENGSGSILHVIECSGNDTYEEVWSGSVPVDNMYWSAPGPDLDRDGRGDFVVAGGTGYPTAVWKFFLYESTGDNQFAPVWVDQVTSGVIEGGVATGDVDGDGWNELLCQVPNRSRVFRATGDDQLEMIWELVGPVFGQGGCRTIAPDLDGDGRGELVWWTQHAPGTAVVFESSDVTGIGTDATSGLTRGPVVIPNPFRRAVRILLPSGAQWEPGPATVGIYGAGGRLVRALTGAERAGARGWVDWDGTDDRGVPVEDGIYFYRLRSSGGQVQSGRMVLVR